MIDTLLTMLPRARERDTLTRFRVTPGNYGLVTLHRPSNVDAPETLGPLVRVLADAARRLPIIFPVHPRTRMRLDEFSLSSLLADSPGLHLTGPLGYLDFLCLTSQARLIVTDSGGLQEESTVLGIPCLTMRSNTERPVTVTEGTSTLVGNDPERLREQIELILSGRYKNGTAPKLWDGRAAERIAAVLAAA
jgi:UDP-N-acetylglucosamine 2-epimerase (non-hydrolysing)